MRKIKDGNNSTTQITPVNFFLKHKITDDQSVLFTTYLLIRGIIKLSKYCQSGQLKTLVFSCVFLQLNVHLSIVSYVYWPSEFLFPASPFRFWVLMDPFSNSLCLSLPQENVLWLFPQLSPPLYLFCLFTCIQTSRFALVSFYFYFISFICWSSHSALKEIFSTLSLIYCLLLKHIQVTIFLKISKQYVSIIL